MARKFKLSKAEIDVLDTIWDMKGQSLSATEIHERMIRRAVFNGGRVMPFPTVRTSLRRLTEKGAVSAKTITGRSLQYLALWSREDLSARAMQEALTKVTHKPLEEILRHLVGAFSPQSSEPEELNDFDTEVARLRAEAEQLDRSSND